MFLSRRVFRARYGIRLYRDSWSLPFLSTLHKMFIKGAWFCDDEKDDFQNHLYFFFFFRKHFYSEFQENLPFRKYQKMYCFSYFLHRADKFVQENCMAKNYDLCQLMRLWYLSYRRPANAQASAQSRQSLHCSHTWSTEEERRSVRSKIRHLAPLNRLRMSVWIMTLRRTKSAIISWAGSFYLFSSKNYVRLPSNVKMLQ